MNIVPQELHIDMHINNLAEFMFITNKDDKVLSLSLNGVEDTKDMFYFLLDLFCKGLVLMFGDGRGVNISELSMEDFAAIKKKMSNAGVLVNLSIYQDIAIDNEEEAKAPHVNLQHIEALDNNMPLNDYHFILRMGQTVYTICFELVHNWL